MKNPQDGALRTKLKVSYVCYFWNLKCTVPFRPDTVAESGQKKKHPIKIT